MTLLIIIVFVHMTTIQLTILTGTYFAASTHGSLNVV